MRKAFFVICTVLVLVGAGSWWLWHRNLGSTPDDMIQADVQIAKGRFTVKNNNRFDWQNVTVVLDGKDGDYSSSIAGKPGYTVTTKGYTIKTPRLRAGATFSSNLVQFTNAHRTHLDPAATHSSEVIIYTEINGGESTWQGDFHP